MDPVGDSFLMKASVGPGSREPQEPRSLQAPPHLGCGWLSPGHRQPIQSQRGIHACGWVTLWGAFMGVGIRHQGKYMKGRHQCSPWSPWASRKGFLGDTALPRDLVQSLGSEACTQSFKALCSLCPPVHLYYGVVCSSLRCLDLPVSRPFLLLSGPHCLQPPPFRLPVGARQPPESFNSQRDSEVEKTWRMIQLHISVFSRKPGQALGGRWKLHHFPGKLYLPFHGQDH